METHSGTRLQWPQARNLSGVIPSTISKLYGTSSRGLHRVTHLTVAWVADLHQTNCLAFVSPNLIEIDRVQCICFSLAHKIEPERENGPRALVRVLEGNPSCLGRLNFRLRSKVHLEVSQACPRRRVARLFQQRTTVIKPDLLIQELVTPKFDACALLRNYRYTTSSVYTSPYVSLNRLL